MSFLILKLVIFMVSLLNLLFIINNLYNISKDHDLKSLYIRFNSSDRTCLDKNIDYPSSNPESGKKNKKSLNPV